MRPKNYLFLLLFVCFTCCCLSATAKEPTFKFAEPTIICDDVSLITVSAITLNSATIQWTSGATGNSWDVAVALDSAFDPTVLPFTNSTTTSLTISSLTAGATYKVWVRSNCEVGGAGGWVGPILFTTNCTAISSFSENFDTTTIPSLPLCWSKIIRGTGVSIAAKVQTVSYNATSSPNAVEITNWGSTGAYDIILVSPMVSNLSAGTHRLRFTTKGPATLEIGTLNNNTSSAVYSEINNVISTAVATEHIISFESFSTTDTFIGIRLAESAQNNYIFIDNVVWEPIPPCPDVTNVINTATTENSANFIWTPAGSETVWNVAIGASTVTDPSTLTFQTVLYENTTSASYFNATNLETLTTYKMWVRSVCTEGNGAWIGPVIFTTSCPSITDFNENFDATANTFLPTCWSKILRGATISGNAKVEVNTTIIVDGKSVGLSNHTSTGSYDVILVSPKVSTLPLASHRLRFFTKFPSTLEVGTLTSNTNAAVFTSFQTVYTAAGLVEYIIDFSTYTGTDQYVGIRIPNNAPQYTNIYLDNLVWQAVPDCPEISNITVPTVSDTTAEINWTATAVESSWQIAYGAVTVTDPNTLTPVAAATEPFELTGLTASTTYKVWVRAVCGTSNGAWIGPVQFTTECPPIAVFSENFDSVTTPNLPLCWSKILRGNGLSQFAFLDTYGTNASSFANFTAPNYVTLNPQGSEPTADVILVTPKLSTLSLGTHRLKFDTFYPGMIQVGTLNGNTATATFTPLQTVESAGFSGSSLVVNFNTYSGTDTYIGIRIVPDPNVLPSINIDNVTWEPIPNCPDVTQILVTGATQTGATFSWTAGGSEPSWQVAVAQSTVSDPNTVTAQSASTTTLTVGGLDPATTYKVWIRSVCAAENGGWIGPLLFTTPCTAANLPYLENFQSVSTPNLPECTTSEVTSPGSNSWVTHNGASSYGFTSKALRYYDSMDNANAYFYTRAINLVAGENYTISYKKGSNSNFSWMACNLKVMYGLSANSGAMTTTLADHVGFYGAGVVENIPFTVAESGVYYFAFYVYSPAYASSVFVDDISIQVNLSNTEVPLSNLSYYPNPVQDILNISNTEPITQVEVYNILGQPMLTIQNNTNDAKIDLSNLPSGTYLAKISSDDKIKSIKIIKK